MAGVVSGCGLGLGFGGRADGLGLGRAHVSSCIAAPGTGVGTKWAIVEWG